VRVLICGSRDFKDESLVRKEVLILAGLTFDLRRTEKATVIAGGARGVDRWAADEARRQGLVVEEFLPDWQHYGKPAGVVRNRQMFEQGKPDEVWAFWDGKSRGTHDSITRARRMKLPLRLWDEAKHVYSEERLYR